MTENALISKIVKAGLDVGGKLHADKRNKDQGYDYLSSDKILSECGQALFEQGIVILPEITAQEIVNGVSSKGTPRFDCRVDFTFTISDGNETILQKWYGMGSDYSVPDKALYKAITSGHKYFLMKLLCIGEGNEDGEHEDDDGKKPARQVDKKTGEIKPKQPAPAQPEQAPARMSIEAAESEYSESAKSLYGILTTDTLRNFQHGLRSTKKALTDEQKRKLDAIEVILAARAAGCPMQIVTGSEDEITF
jgi:hypothetical protein